MEPAIVMLGLGTNKGDRIENLRQAVHRMHYPPFCLVQKLSSIYETEPVGYKDQSWFLNAAIEVLWFRSPEELLEYTQSIETQLGRTQTHRWGPRSIDIDILYFGNSIIKFKDLKVPHPRLRERLFVLIPMNEIAQGWIDPEVGNTIDQLLKNCIDTHKVQKILPQPDLWPTMI